MTELVIRPSSLTGFQDCPRRWSARHLSKELAAAGYDLRSDTVRSVGAHVGTGVHAAASFSMQEKMRTGALGTDTDAEELGIEAFRDRAGAEGVDWDDATPDVTTAEKQIRRMSRAWRRGDAATMMPLQVEERLEATVAPGLVLSGQIDALAGDPDHVVRDLKTGTRRRGNAAQYGAYALIWRAHGHDPVGIVEDYLARVRLSKEQPPPEAHAIDLAAAQHEAFETIEAIGRAVDEFRRRVADPNGRPPEMAFRANPASALCSARWCPAHGTNACRAHV